MGNRTENNRTLGYDNQRFGEVDACSHFFPVYRW